MTIELGRGTGPLRGVKVVELAGIGPGPHACMILADLGADVIRVDRPGGQALTGGPHDLLNRGRPSVALDLKHPDGVATVLDLVAGADVLRRGTAPRYDGAARPRPGRLPGPQPAAGLRPDDRLGPGRPAVPDRRPRPRLHRDHRRAVRHGAGPGRPHFPTNLVGDFGGGSTYLVIGILAALLESRLSGEGQVVDAAIVDGTAHLNAMATGFLAGGVLREDRAANLLDGGAPFYDLYETADGKHLAIGALEPQFYDELVAGLGIADTAPDRNDPANRHELRRLIADAVRGRTQAEWVEVFDRTDACVAPVLPMTEAFGHPHLAARGTFVERDGMTQPAPAPRFSRTAPSLTTPPPAKAGQDTRDALHAWGITDVDALLGSGAAVQV